MPKPKTTDKETVKWAIVGDKITQTTTKETVTVEVFSKKDILKNPGKYSQELVDFASTELTFDNIDFDNFSI